VSTIEELLERKSSGSGLENREYGRRDPSRGTLHPQQLALTSPTSGGRSAGIVRSWTQTMEFICLFKHHELDHHSVTFVSIKFVFSFMEWLRLSPLGTSVTVWPVLPTQLDA
jgi:hypothetical protein